MTLVSSPCGLSHGDGERQLVVPVWRSRGHDLVPDAFLYFEGFETGEMNRKGEWPRDS